MAINRQYIISKVKQAIDLLPYEALAVRENINKYNEKVGYNKISNLKGLLYDTESNKTISILLQDKGHILPTSSKNFLIPYDENSIKLLKSDLIFVKDKAYKITNLGENLEMYFLMQIEEVQGIVLKDNLVQENNSLYEITEFDSGYIVKFG